MSELLEARIVKPGAMSKAGLRKVALDLLRQREALREAVTKLCTLVDKMRKIGEEVDAENTRLKHLLISYHDEVAVLRARLAKWE